MPAFLDDRKAEPYDAYDQVEFDVPGESFRISIDNG